MSDQTRDPFFERQREMLFDNKINSKTMICRDYLNCKHVDNYYINAKSNNYYVLSFSLKHYFHIMSEKK